MISVVVTIYNERRVNDMFELLRSLEEQNSSSFEVVVVVEKSERLFLLLNDYLSKSNLKHYIIFAPGLRGISYSRNLGVKKSQGEIVAFTDDDAVTSSDWIERMEKAYERHPEAIGVTGQAYPLWIDSSQSWFPTELQWMVGCTTWRQWSTEHRTNVSSGVNMSFRREAFSKVMFREEMGGGASSEGKLGLPNEDNEYALEVTANTSRPIIFDPSIFVFHKVHPFRLRIGYLRKYAFWQGCAEARYTRRKYSAGRRNRFLVQVLQAGLADIAHSFLPGKGRRIARKRSSVWMTVFTFFTIGFLSYSIGVNRRIMNLV